MEQTTNYNLKKPSYEDFGDVEIINQNADKIDIALKNVSNVANAKYAKPSNGIPKTDLQTTVQASLDKADASAGAAALTALQTQLTNHLAEDDDWAGSDYEPFKQRVTQHLDDYVKHSANGGTTAGTATAYTCNSSPNPEALVDKMGLVIAIHVDSSSNPTLKWGSLAAKPIKKPNGSTATLKKDGLYSLRYNAVNDSFILQGEGGEYGNVNSEDVVQGKIFGSEEGLKIGTLLHPSNLPRSSSTFTIPGTHTYTVPSNVYKLNFAVGGGGGGGGGGKDTYSLVGGGGGGGGFTAGNFNVTPGQILTIVVGAGGRGGVSFQNGNPGGESRIVGAPGANGGGAGGVSIYHSDSDYRDGYYGSGPGYGGSAGGGGGNTAGTGSISGFVNIPGFNGTRGDYNTGTGIGGSGGANGFSGKGGNGGSNYQAGTDGTNGKVVIWY